MSDIAAQVKLSTIGVHYVEGELTPHAAADTPAVASGIVNIWHVRPRQPSNCTPSWTPAPHKWS